MYDTFIEELYVISRELLAKNPEATLADSLVVLLLLKTGKDYSGELL